jgi:hypothetical protein
LLTFSSIALGAESWPLAQAGANISQQKKTNRAFVRADIVNSFQFRMILKEDSMNRNRDGKIGILPISTLDSRLVRQYNTRIGIVKKTWNFS